MIWENGIETCIISYKKQIASPGSMQNTGCLGLVHWDDPEGWYGEGGGRGVQDWEYMYTHGGFMFVYPPLQGEFLTTGSPGKSQMKNFAKL